MSQCLLAPLRLGSHGAMVLIRQFSPTKTAPGVTGENEKKIKEEVDDSELIDWRSIRA